MTIYKCDICHKEFKSANALAGHMRVHGDSGGGRTDIWCCCIITRREVVVHNLDAVQSRIKYCKHCGKPLTSNRKFCDHSCSAAFNNSSRIRSEESKQNTRVGVAKSLEETGYVRVIGKDGKECYTKNIKAMTHPRNAEGEFSVVYFLTCKHCGTLFSQRHTRKYCPRCSPLYDKDFRQRFKFTFSVYDYPDLFDLDHVARVGWYSRGGTAGKWNPAGLSRDHRVSVNDAIRYGYDPFYISHPINCELLSWEENNRKKTKSSISYEELVNQVNEYEMKRKTPKISGF